MTGIDWTSGWWHNHGDCSTKTPILPHLSATWAPWAAEPKKVIIVIRSLNILSRLDWPASPFLNTQVDQCPDHLPTSWLTTSQWPKLRHLSQLHRRRFAIGVKGKSNEVDHPGYLDIKKLKSSIEANKDDKSVDRWKVLQWQDVSCNECEIFLVLSKRI